jgi:HEAT repeat protein
MPDRNASAATLIDRMAAAPTSAKSDLLDLLGVVGGAKALEGVSAAASDANEDVQNAATRVLGGWMSADAAPVLLELAKTGNDKFRVRCLRGYIRIARQLDVPRNERIAMCREALAVAQRDDEKKLALEVLERYPSGQSLTVAVDLLQSETLKEAAARAAVAIAGERAVAARPALVAKAMEEVLEATADSELSANAKALLRRAKAKLPKN